MKTLHELFGDFYSPEHLLSYGRPWMISVGSRSIGKSTGWMIWLIYDYLKNGNKFIYIRRTDDEVKKTAPSACDSAWYILRDNGYPVFSIIAKQGKFWLMRQDPEDGEPVEEEMGMYFSLSQAYKYKSANFGANHYNNILYDEFINIDSTKYLGTKTNPTYEYDRALELYQTVDRGVGRPFRNETKFIFIANLATYYNPIFMGLGIDEYLRTDTKNLAPKGKQWALEQSKKVKATEEIKQSYAYQLSNERNADYAYDNIAFDEKVNFVKKINDPMKPLFCLKWNSTVIGVYYWEKEQYVYLSTKHPPLTAIALTADAQDKINYQLALKPYDALQIQQLKALYMRGRIICETRKIRYIITNYFMYNS